ncbi:MAG TPA: MerR family transcriptional regulator [Vicinamibacterales bacterium]|nr:MerR family transcriptional regulator [Vicinamibacterales bacterium]
MPDIDIPKRALFKASEVCEIASVQPYVLRSWETEFPDLGVSKQNGGPRVYRRSDVERVLRIKQLVFADGLTLAGVRRRIEEERPPVLEGADAAPIQELLSRNARERLAEVKRGLRAILDLLSARPHEAEVRHVARPSARPVPPRKAPVRRAKHPNRKRR